MQLRLRIKNKDGIVRIENSTKIQEVMINEDLLHPDQESIAIGFRNQDSSGIIDMTVAEFEQFYGNIGSNKYTFLVHAIAQCIRHLPAYRGNISEQNKPDKSKCKISDF